jgi:uncharacterized protein DUF4864
MKQIFAFLILITLALPAAAENHRNPNIEAVISGQINAFLVDDFDAAFTFAGPGIRRFFGTSERFGKMVREGYPMVWRAARVEFLNLDTIKGQPVQRVLLEDAQGAYFVAEYTMIKTENGWQISGVRIQRAEEMAA